MSKSRIVSGEGRLDAPIVLIGAYPGREELRRGRPFCGLAGLELDRYLSRAGINRADCYITNLIKTDVGGVDEDDLEPGSSLVRAAAADLRQELGALPNIQMLVALGSLPTRVLAPQLGLEVPSLEAAHGLSFYLENGPIFIPAYNPAAGIRRPDLMLRIDGDFQAVATPARHKAPVDQCPNPCYRIGLPPGANWSCLLDSTLGVDTEGSPEDPFSMQVSAQPGLAWLFFPAQLRHSPLTLAAPGSPPAILHNSLHDLPVLKALGVPVAAFLDTMIMAYHLCDEPQSLKALAFRHCGMQMREYSEVVAPAQQALSLTYLEATVQLDWPMPPVEKIWRAGKLADTKPWPIKRHLEKLLADTQGVSIGDLRKLLAGRVYRFGEQAPNTIDLHKRWLDIEEEKRRPVEDALGPMPAASLEHVPIEAAVEYACRDADATRRVYFALAAKYESVFGEKLAAHA